MYFVGLWGANSANVAPLTLWATPHVAHKKVIGGYGKHDDFLPLALFQIIPILKASWPLTISLLWPLAATDTQIVCSNRIILLAHCQCTEHMNF